MDALSYTEAEAKVLDHLASLSSDAVEVKSLKPLGVSEAIGLDVDGESYHYYIVGLTDGRGKATSQRVLVKELGVVEACHTAESGTDSVATSVRLLDVANVIR